MRENDVRYFSKESADLDSEVARSRDGLSVNHTSDCYLPSVPYFKRGVSSFETQTNFLVVGLIFCWIRRTSTDIVQRMHSITHIQHHPGMCEDGIMGRHYIWVHRGLFCCLEWHHWTCSCMSACGWFTVIVQDCGSSHYCMYLIAFIPNARCSEATPWYFSPATTGLHGHR